MLMKAAGHQSYSSIIRDSVLEESFRYIDVIYIDGIGQLVRIFKLLIVVDQVIPDGNA